MTIQQEIAVIKYGDALELFTQAEAAVKQCEYILGRLTTKQYAAQREGNKAAERVAKREIKNYTEKCEKLRLDAFLCAQEVMRHAGITAEFGFESSSPALDKAQAFIAKCGC